MSRIRRIGYALADKQTPNTVRQAFRLREQTLKIVDSANEFASTSRRITKRAAFTVVLRSLEKTKGLPFSLREHLALKDLSTYINLAQHNKADSFTHSHTDLLPVSHPRSTRLNSLSASALREAHARWYSDDSRITNETARAVLASAFTSLPGSAEHLYYTSLLSGLPQGTVPTEALLAAFGDGNSSAARRERAMRQRRDRKGRFAYEGGGLRALIRRLDGKVFSLTGRTVAQGEGDNIQIELPDGRIAEVPASKGEFVKAVLPTPDGYSPREVKPSISEEGDVIDEKDIKFVDAPAGWSRSPEREQDNVWEDGAFLVDITEDADGNKNFAVYNKDDMENPLGQYKNWAEVQDSLRDNEEVLAKPKARLPKPEDMQAPAAEKPETFEFNYPAGAYKIKPGAMYEAEGRVDEESTNFTDDPAELAQMFDPRDIKAALEEAIIPQGENENAFGYGNLGFNRGDEMVDANALYNALKEQDEDADMELARIYDEALGGTANQDALNDFRKQPEQVAGETPALEESFKRMLEEGVADVAPAAEEPNFDPAEMDMVPLPPVLEGLGDAEMKQFMETKDHTPFLPANDDVEPPVGYNKLNPAPFTSWREVTADNPDPVLPEGFSDNPVFLAQSVPQADLEAELRRALEPGNEMPGYGAIKLQTEDGEEFVANVPGEAIRDALQLNGVDTNKLIEDIYNEGEAQRVNEDLARQILDQEEGQVAEMPSVLDMLEEEEALADKYEEEGEGMPRGDAQAIAEAEMRRKYGKSAMDALLDLDPKEGARLLDLRERKVLGELDVPQRTVEVRKKTISPELIQDFEVGALEEVPDGLAEYPKPADIAPADANAPYRIVSKVTDLQPGDITVGDHFVITEIGEKVPGTDRRKIKGYYPGHVEQDTKQWNEWREIEVIRGAQAPEKGDLPVLSKPKPQDFGKQKRGADGKWDFANEADKENFLAAQAIYDAQLAEAKKGFIDPTSPSNQPHRTIVRAADLQPGDISADPKKGHFVIERIFTDENTKPGFVSIEGYYPGHVTQRKEWKVDTQIDVYRNVEPPAKGDLPELHQPHLVVNGKWRPDKDPAKRAEYEKQIAELANVWQAPENLPVVENKEQKPEENKDIPNAVVVKRPKAPKTPQIPAFQGDWAGIVREAGGDWSKLKEILKGKTLVFFDFETTGLNVGDGDEPWQIGAVKVVDGEIVERKNIYMNPGRSIEGTYAAGETEGVPHAVDADGNKLTDEFLAQQKDQKAAFEEFLAWAGPDALLGAHNVAFDDKVARHLSDKYGVDFNPAGYVDTMIMARDIFKDQEGDNKPPNNKLVGLAEHFGIELKNAHSADADSEATANLFGKLVDKAIEFDAGKDLLDVDARNDEYIKNLEIYDAERAKYEEEIANFAAAKALNDGLRGGEVNLDNVVVEAKGVAPVDPEGITLGPVGNELEQPKEKPDAVVLDFTPNAVFPRGKMLLMPKEWALDDNNTVLLDREDARMRNLLPGDFMQSKDGNIVWQVVAVRAGEDFGLEPGRVKVYRRNVDTGQLSTDERWHGTRLDGVRRPINPADLNAPETVAQGEQEPFIANNPENPELIEQKSEPGDVVYRNSMDIGGLAEGYVRIKKNQDGRYEVIVGIVDNNDEAVFSFKEDYRTYEGAKAEAEAILQERAQEFLAQKRDEAAEPAEARAKDVPISRGNIPANADVAEQLIEVENLPNDLLGNISIKDIGEEKPRYKTEASLQDAEGEVIAEQFSEHPNKAAAEKESRDFIARAADAVQNPEPIQAPATKPKKKEVSEEEKRVLKQNDWVEANAGLLVPTRPEDIQVGDFFFNKFFNRYEEILVAPKYVGYLNRWEFEVFNVKNNEKEIRFFEGNSPIHNMRRPGIPDQEVVIEKVKAAPRGGKRRDIKRKPLDERIVAKTGRPMGGNFEEEGFYRDRNGDPIEPGDFVIHNNPEKAKKYGVGKVVRRVGAQVTEGMKVGGIGRAGKVYLDYVEVDFPDGKRRPFKARMLIKQNKAEAPEQEVQAPVAVEEQAPVQQELPIAQSERKPAPEVENAPKRIFKGDVQDKKDKEYKLSIVKIGDQYEAAVFPQEGDQKPEIIAKGTNLPEVQAVVNRFIEDIVDAEDGDKVLRSYAGVPEPEVQPVLTGITPQVPELPKVGSLELKEAKVRGKALAAQLADKEVPQISPEQIKDDARRQRYQEAMNARKDDIIRILNNRNQPKDVRRREAWTKDMNRLAAKARKLGWFEEARQLEALANFKEDIALRPIGEDLEAKLDGFRGANADIVEAQHLADNLFGYRGADALKDLGRYFADVNIYRDPYNPKYRNAVKGGLRNADELIQRAKGLQDSEDKRRILEVLEKFRAGFADLGDLPKIPVPEVGSDAANQYVAKIAREFEGMGIDTFRDDQGNLTVRRGDKVWGDWVYADNLSSGINSLFLLENSITGEKILIKYDDDYKRRGGHKFYGNGIKAEEMVAQIYKELGFAQPAVKVINEENAAEGRDEKLGGLAVMEYAEVGFFGLQNIKNHGKDPIYDLNDISPEYQKEVLEFVIANAITGNTDRHGGNFMWGRDPDTGLARVVPIDNGLALFNGAFGKAEANAQDPLFLDPLKTIQGHYGNKHQAMKVARQYIAEVGADQAENEIVEFAERMRDRATKLKLIDERATAHLEARANYVIQNAKRFVRNIG